MANINISQILIKRGNTAAAGNYIGPLGELVVDTGLRTIRVQDGVTAGGMAVLATLSGYNQLSGNIANLQTTTANISANLSAFQTLANATTANISANLTAFRTYANATFGTSNFGNANVAAYLTANPQGGQYSNANVAAYLTTSNIITGIDANVTAANLQITNLWSNAGVQSANIATLFANAGVQADAIIALQANIGSYYIWANANVAGLYSSILGANTAWQANAGTQADAIASLIANAGVQSANIGTLQTNAATQDTAINSITANISSFYTYANLHFADSSFGNSNVAAYLPTYTGMIGSVQLPNYSQLVTAGDSVQLFTAGSFGILANAGHSPSYAWTFDTDGNIIYQDGTRNSGSSVYASPNYTINSNGNTYIRANTGQTAQTWTFGTDGTLTLPDGSGVAGGFIYGAPGSAGGIINGGTGYQQFFAQDDGAYVQTSVGNAGTVFNSWKFGTDGNLNLPQDGYLRVGSGIVPASFAASPAPVITGFSTISAQNFTFLSNGVNILSTVAGNYSNVNVAAYLSASTTGNVGAGNLTVVNNFSTNVISANSFTYANGTSILDGIGGTYSNANVASYLVANPQDGNYSNVNVAAYIAGNLSTINANIVGANAAIVTANTAMKSYVDAVTTAWTAANTIQAGQINGANAAIVTANLAVVSYVNTQTNSLATSANANTLAYLNSGFTVSGNITAGNIITSGPVSGNISNVNIVSANSVQLTSNLTVSGTGTIGGNLYVYGNLQVSGTTTTVNQATLSVTDKIITVSNGSVSGSQANGAGLSVAGASANLYYTSIGDQWNVNKPFYAPGIYDNSNRVVSTSSGAGNLTISGTGVNLTSVGPGAVTTGSATAIPVITTDAYGRITSITTAAVSSTLNTAGTTGTGTVSLTSQSLSVTGTNGITATASGQTITITDNLWPAANANLGTATTNITALQANIGSYYVWANANVAGLSSQITGANAAIVTANSAVVSYVNTLNTAMASNVAGANAAIVTANTALKGYTDNQITTANTAVVSYVNTRTNSLATGANTNTAAYLAAGITTNFTTTGNVSATNVIVNGQPTTYGTVSPDYIQVEKSADQASVAKNADINFNVTTATNGGIAFSSNIFTLIAGKTYLLEATLCTNTFTSTGAFIWYSWVDATTNAQLDTSNGAATSTGSSGVSVPATWAANDNYSSSARLIYTPNTNQTVKLRATDGSGTCTVLAIGTRATITQLNPSIAVQATATGTVNNQYSSVTLTSNQVIGSPGTPTNIVFQSATGTVPYNTSTGVWTLTSGVTYNLTAVLAVTGASNYLGYQWVDSVSGTALSTALGFATLATTQVSSVPLSIVYTPNTNQTIALRNVNGQYASVIANYSWATVTQINQAFALNALDTISTTGNVSVGGNLAVTGNIAGTAVKITAPTFQAVTPSWGLSDVASAAWFLLGTWNTSQAGNCLYMRLLGHCGYNGITTQNQVTELMFVTSNDSSYITGSSGNYYAAGSASVNSRLGTGATYQAPNKFRIIQVSKTQYQIYAYFGSAYMRNSNYSIQITPGDTWTDGGGNGGVTAPTGNYVEITPSSF